MNYTENYHLPQWVKSDRIMMEDFNQMCADIESGMSATAQATAQAAAQAAALPYVVGTYTGNGSRQRDFNLGFRPQFVLICSDQGSNDASSCGTTVLMAGPTVTSNRLYMTDTGFRIDFGTGSVNLPRINESGRLFNYIAFR